MKLLVGILLVFILNQVLSTNLESLCFYGGELVVPEWKSTGKAECLFGPTRVSGRITDQTLICQYPALDKKQIRVQILSETDNIDFGLVPVESCVQITHDQGCPGDFPQVRIELKNSQAVQHDYLCVWNGVSVEVSKQGTTLVCSIPHNPTTLNWRLSLKTQDRRGYIAMTGELLTFQYDDCQDQVPEILGLEKTIYPWSRQVRVSIPSDSRRNAWANSDRLLCKYTIGKTVHQEFGKITDDGWCPTPVLPVGECMLEISADGRTWSKPRIIVTESGIDSVSESDGLLRLHSTQPFDSNLEYTCYFDSQPVTATLDDDYTLTCPAAQAKKVGLLVHDRKMNRAASVMVRDIEY